MFHPTYFLHKFCRAMPTSADNSANSGSIASTQPSTGIYSNVRSDSVVVRSGGRITVAIGESESDSEGSLPVLGKQDDQETSDVEMTDIEEQEESGLDSDVEMEDAGSSPYERSNSDGETDSEETEAPTPGAYLISRRSDGVHFLANHEHIQEHDDPMDTEANSEENSGEVMFEEGSEEEAELDYLFEEFAEFGTVEEPPRVLLQPFDVPRETLQLAENVPEILQTENDVQEHVQLVVNPQETLQPKNDVHKNLKLASNPQETSQAANHPQACDECVPLERELARLRAQKPRNIFQIGYVAQDLAIHRHDAHGP